MIKLLFILVLNLGIVQYASAVCNACTTRGVACINEKDFNLCFKGVPDTSKTYSCMGVDEICTKFYVPCMDKKSTSAKPACGDTTNCGKCEGKEDDGTFTCTSRTTFTMCMDGVLTGIRDTCPENQMCDVALGKQKLYPCVPSCKEQEIEFCDLYDAIDAPETTTEVPTTTTTAEPTTQPETTTTETITTTTKFSPTPSLPTQIPPERVCSQQSAVGRYPYPNDPTCEKYIYCFTNSGFMHYTFMKCPNNYYFNPSTRVCGKDKPNSCR